MMSRIRLWFPLGYLIFLISFVSSHIAWTNIQTSLVEGQVDTWTKSLSGCPCKNGTQSDKDGDCACCMEDSGGCQCGIGVTNRCGQCGLEEFCDNMCNITISSSAMRNSSGRSFGEIKSPSSAIGPLFCWYKLMAEPNERIEIQIYRIKRLGKLDLENRRCLGGSLQFLRGSRLTSTSPLDLSICGENERYSPPIVLFKDYQEGVPGIATLFFRVDVPSSSRSQFIAHYAFVPIWEKNGSHFLEETRLRIRGGAPLPGSNSLEEFLGGESQEGEEVTSYLGMGCDWSFHEKNCSSHNSSCSFASPGFPGIYDPNKACKYLINRDENINSRIRITFNSFNLPPNLCVEHFVSIYDGKTIRDPILHTLCGYVSPGESYDFNGPSILVEFSSSHVLPPYHFNGFAATIEFPTSADIDEEEEVDGLEDEDDHGEDDEEYDDDIEHDYGEDTEYEDDEIVSIPEFDDDPDEIYTAETRRNQKRKNFSQKGPSISLAEECRVEYQRERRGPSSGLISSDNFEGLKGKKCRLILKGYKGDVLKILFRKLQLTGDKECGAFIRISTPSIRRSPKLNIVHKICSPFDGSFSNSQIPLLINSSTVYLDFKFAGKSRLDYFGALFDFHNVLTQGHPVPNSTCDTIYSSYGSPLSRGPMKVFGESELIRQLGGFVRCSTALIPQQGQTVTIKIKSVYEISSSMSSECITSCNENGCRCQTHRHGLGDVNYVLLASFNGGNIACLCGNFTDLLPLKVVSSTSLVITYNAVSGNENLFIYTSSFNFNAKSYNDLCSPQKHIMEPQGMISSGAVKKRRKKDGKGLNYHHGYCQWFFDVGSQIVLNIKTDTKHYDCSTWNISLIPEWSRNPVSKYIFCPEDVSKEYLLNTSKITLRLSSLSPFPVDYVISWRPLNSSRMEQEFSPTTEDILMSDEEERPPVFKEQKNKGAASAEASSSSSESLLISNKLYLFVLYVRICYMCVYNILYSS